jgi:hypothetical protein
MSIYILQEVDCGTLQRHSSSLSSTRVYLNRHNKPEVQNESCGANLRSYDSHPPEQPTHCSVLQPFIYKATTLDLQLVPASTTGKANRHNNRPVDTGGATLRYKTGSQEAGNKLAGVAAIPEQEIDNGATESVDTMMPTISGSQEADDDGCSAEWHAGTTNKNTKRRQ